jgi:predicted kinase
MHKPTLYIFSGLPGSGKSTLAKRLASATGAAYLRIDTIEQAIRDLCDFKVEGEGYRLAYRVAADNLKTGNSVVADSCNPVAFTRREWNEVATKINAAFIDIEIRCSDPAEHRNRIENRRGEVAGLELPTWQAVQNRKYDPWTSQRIAIDTADKTIESSFQELLGAIRTTDTM